MKFFQKIIIIVLLIFSVSSCIVVKHENTQSDVAPEVSLSPKPEIAMSDKLVRSDKGDMIAFLPEEWFFIDIEQDVSPDIFAVAVNPEYNLSAVFSVIRTGDAVKTIIDQEGYVGLARISLDKKTRKSGGLVEQTGKYTNINFGNLEFVKYEFTTTSGALIARAAVFESSIGQYYEVSLIPLNDVSMNPIPTASELDKIFHSILATVKY